MLPMPELRFPTFIFEFQIYFPKTHLSITWFRISNFQTFVLYLQISISQKKISFSDFPLVFCSPFLINPCTLQFTHWAPTVPIHRYLSTEMANIVRIPTMFWGYPRYQKHRGHPHDVLGISKTPWSSPRFRGDPMLWVAHWQQAHRHPPHWHGTLAHWRTRV